MVAARNCHEPQAGKASKNNEKIRKVVETRGEELSKEGGGQWRKKKTGNNSPQDRGYLDTKC